MQSKGSKRLHPEEREQQIVNRAIEYFAKHGFSASTRDLATSLGVSQPLLYRYFESKEALIARVYCEVFQWREEWENIISDNSISIKEKLYNFYLDYTTVLLQEKWVRIFIFASLSNEKIQISYLDKLRRRIFRPLLVAIRRELNLPAPRNVHQQAQEMEMLWSLHGAFFYLGVRKWVYGISTPEDIESFVSERIDHFLIGAPAIMQKFRDSHE